MKITRRLETTTEEEKSLTLALRRTTPWRYCHECGATGAMLELSEAAGRSGYSPPELLDLAASRALHASETPTGDIYLCVASLARLAPDGMK
jgi:hypothetical protein